MPSASFQLWQIDRRPRLAQIDAHCVATGALTPPNVLLDEESLRGYVMLLSGHFQGFCRNLYSECAQIFALRAPASLQATIQVQFFAELKLNHSNPTMNSIRRDFERFGFTLDFNADPANRPRAIHLDELNRWRNAVAHQEPTAPAGMPALTLTAVKGWLISCDGIANWLDAIMYNELLRILGAPPW